MKVALTGGSGFVGTNLMMYLAEHEPDTEIVIVDTSSPQVLLPESARYIYADVRNLQSMIMALDGCEEVYHLAGILGTSELIAVSSLACEVNVVGANNVMDACRHVGVKRVYNVAKPHFDGYDENAYTLTKHAGELIGRLYQEKYDMEVATVRWLNAVGPWQHLYPVRKYVPVAVLLSMYGFPIEVYGDGNQTIDPIDTRDLSRFTVHACRNLGKEPRVVDLGSGIAISCNRAAQIIAEVVEETGVVKQSVKIENIPMREGEKPGVNLVADMSYWKKKGLSLEYSFGDSVRSVVGYIKGLPDHVKANALKFYGRM